MVTTNPAANVLSVTARYSEKPSRTTVKIKAANVAKPSLFDSLEQSIFKAQTLCNSVTKLPLACQRLFSMRETSLSLNTLRSRINRFGSPAWSRSRTPRHFAMRFFELLLSPTNTSPVASHRFTSIFIVTPYAANGCCFCSLSASTN